MIVLVVVVLVVVVLVVVVLVMVVSVVVSPTHHGDGDVEHFHVLGLKLEHIVTGFEVVEVDDGARWAGRGSIEGFLGFEMVVLIVLVMLAFFVMVFLIVVVLVVVVLVMVVHVVTLFVMVWEFQRVSGVVAIKLGRVIFLLGQVHGFHGPVQTVTELVNEDGLVIQGGLTRWHGVGHCGSGGIVAHALQGGVDPGFEAEAVVQEQVRFTKPNEVLSGGGVIVNGDVTGGNQFNVHQTAADGRHQLLNVVG